MKKSTSNIIDSVKMPFVLVCVMWVIAAFEAVTMIELAGFGIHPRDITSLHGILLSPLLHGGFPHLISNSIPFLVLGTTMLYFYPKTSYFSIGIIYLLSGLGTFIIGSSGVHIGASGVIYGLVGFLIASGFVRWYRITPLVIAIIVAFFYGGIIGGIFPSMPGVSWEGHLSGAASGVFAAYLTRKSKG